MKYNLALEKIRGNLREPLEIKEFPHTMVSGTENGKSGPVNHIDTESEVGLRSNKNGLKESGSARNDLLTGDPSRKLNKKSGKGVKIRKSPAG